MSMERRAMRHARELWPRLAASAGLEARDYMLSPLSVRREGAEAARVVVLAKGDTCWVIKFILNGQMDRRVAAVEAHRTAAQALADTPECAAPSVWASDADTGALLLDWIAGPSLLQALTDDPAKMAAALAHAGRWMAALHTGGARGSVPFKADWMLGRLDRMAADGVVAPGTFATCRAALAKVAQDARGTEMPRAIIHGDLTAKNLIWDGQVMTGIDFENTGLHPVARDAALLLCDIAIWCDTAEGPTEGHLLSLSVMDAFAQGLGQDAVPAPVLRFFIGLNLLQRWARLATDQTSWSTRRAHAFRRISAAAPRVLLDGT